MFRALITFLGLGEGVLHPLSLSPYNANFSSSQKQH